MTAKSKAPKVIDVTVPPPADPACGSADITGYAYGGAGNLTPVAEAKGQTTTFSYDSMDRLISAPANAVGGRGMTGTNSSSHRQSKVSLRLFRNRGLYPLSDFS